MGEEKIYTGVFPLDKALKSVSIGRSGGRPTKSSSYTSIKEQEYNKLHRWMGNYSSRLALDESGKITGVRGKPVLPTAEELRRDFGMTWGRLKAVAKNNDDVGAAFHYNTDISEEQKRNLEKLGLKTGVTYVALESLYPFLSNAFGKQK